MKIPSEETILSFMLERVGDSQHNFPTPGKLCFLQPQQINRTTKPTTTTDLGSIPKQDQPGSAPNHSRTYLRQTHSFQLLGQHRITSGGDPKQSPQLNLKTKRGVLQEKGIFPSAPPPGKTTYGCGSQIGTKKWNPGKQKHGLKPAVPGLILTQTHIPQTRTAHISMLFFAAKPRWLPSS